MYKKRIFSVFIPLCLLCLLILIIWALGRIGATRAEKVREQGIETVGEAFDESSRMISIRYTVNGRSYVRSVGKGFSNIYDGEEFLIKYLPDDPETIVVFFDNPILSAKYEYQETTCIAIEKSFSVLSFQYQVNGQFITRKAKYTSGQSLNPADYVVRFRAADPDVGYLCAVDSQFQ